MKKHVISLIFILFIASTLISQDVKVLTLGTFHFSFPNLDIVKIDDNDQIDVLAPEHQEEIKEIVDRIARFRPTVIAIESDPKKQAKTDSLYNAYLSGDYELGRDEHEQIGFRLARQFNHKKLYCTNDWGTLTENVERIFNGDDPLARQKFMDYFYSNPDSSIYYDWEYVFKTKSILDELRRCNSEEHLKKDLGNYLISIFKYQTEEDEFFGVDFTTGWWFNRNLRIFRNIQNIPTEPGERILVIYGTDHMNILNILFDASPEYELVRVNDYLK